MSLGNPGNSSGTFQYNVDYSYVFRNNTLVLKKPKFKLYLKENIAGRRIPRKPWQEEECDRNPVRKRSTKETLAGRGTGRRRNPGRKTSTKKTKTRSGKETPPGRGER
jgi:hypothetical protein